MTTETANHDSAGTRGREAGETALVGWVIGYIFRWIRSFQMLRVDLSFGFVLGIGRLSLSFGSVACVHLLDLSSESAAPTRRPTWRPNLIFVFVI